ncbi:MAG: sulfatase [Sedimentisphaerales bacterium]|nr:sulfatase [Sedimentisphaerales bacterium]
MGKRIGIATDIHPLAMFFRKNIIILASLFISTTLWAAEDNQPRPNILVVLGDDATFSDLSLYGGTNVRTPRLEKFASEGKVFNRAYLCMSMCQPCRTELYTGLYPMRTGTCWNHCKTLPGTKSVCHHLGELGYRVGLAGKNHVVPKEVFPFDNVKGFEDNCVAATADYNCEGIANYMSADKEQPFFLVVGLTTPHVVWTVGDASHFKPKELKLPANFVDTPETRRDYAAYLAEIEYMDKQLGDILDTLEKSGQADNTIVIFSSEQGAQFPGCKWTNYETGVRTGMAIRWPGHIAAQSRTEAIVQYADVLPTVVELAGGEVSPGIFDGSSFADVLLDKKQEHRQYAYAMHNNMNEGSPYPIRSVRDKQYRYIRNLMPERMHIQKYVMGVNHTHYWRTWLFAAGQREDAYKLVNRYMSRPAEELYNTEIDPYELNNLACDPQYSQIKEKLSEELDKWMAEQKDPGAALDANFKKS